MLTMTEFIFSNNNIAQHCQLGGLPLDGLPIGRPFFWSGPFIIFTAYYECWVTDEV